MHPARASATALLIARAMLLADRDPRLHVLVSPGAATALAALPGVVRAWFNLVSHHRPGRAVLGALERLVLPAIVAHYLARKRWIEATVRAALDRGVHQVVVLGAGYDPLTGRLHRERPDVRFFELDHPATQAPKARTLGPAAGVSCLPIDLAVESPAATLRACPAFSTGEPTLFLAEGLLMYLPEARVAALLRELVTLTTPPAGVLFTCMARAADGAISFHGEHAAIGWWLRWRHEPFQWGIAAAELPGFLQACGLHVLAVADHDTLRADMLAPRGLAGLSLTRGEYLCHCATLPAP